MDPSPAARKCCDHALIAEESFQNLLSKKILKIVEVRRAPSELFGGCVYFWLQKCSRDAFVRKAWGKHQGLL